MEECTLRPIAHIQSAFAEKFGIPRQSGLVESLPAQVVFEPEFRSAEEVNQAVSNSQDAMERAQSCTSA